MRLSSWMQETSAVGLATKTGCRFPCRHFEFRYTRTLQEGELVVPVSELGTSQAARVKLYFREAGYETRKEVQMYATKDLVADVGGYLGLLLGASVLDVYDLITPSLWVGWYRRER